jgi:hypothetical protein
LPALREGNVKTKKTTVRALPAILTLAAVVFFGDLGQIDLAQAGSGRKAEGWGGEVILLTPPASPLPCPVAGELIAISEQAAALTGSLAFAERNGRPQAASKVAADVRALQRRAAAQPGGAELAGVLGDLAGALEAYSVGDVREASARNAGIRETLKQQQSTCGGKR